MGYIRSKAEELTGYQEHSDYNPAIDLQCDFVMVYGTEDDMPQRISHFKENGYVVHVMTGSAWGEYQDYLNGSFDGRTHYDEQQTDRNGRPILHGPDVPYMVPTISFADYLTKKLYPAIDAGAKAIYLEEPEFWEAGGYSEAFKREYRLYYRKDWEAPHKSVDSHYRCAMLKAALYARTLSRVFAALKEYAMVNYSIPLRCYVPTHSILNYCQWKILSPESALTELSEVDGYIAQVWTGTSRVKNLYHGVLAERTFETAYLEYGIMTELVSGTGRDMWLLHDPIEDNPSHTWEDFKDNYFKTVTASLLHPKNHHFEVCPWPNRVFNGYYPKNVRQDDESSKLSSSHGKPMPKSYRTLVCNISQMLGDMDRADYSFCESNCDVGIFLSDTALYQRSFPDSILADSENIQSIDDALTGELTADKLNKIIASFAFPDFYGLTLPILKNGIPVHPVSLENVRRFPGYLNEYKYLILSYDFLKPLSPDINMAVAAWVNAGGTLISIGDNNDPYNNINGWWNENKSYASPAEHLFELLTGSKNFDKESACCGKGKLYFHNIRPALLSLSKTKAEAYKNFVFDILDNHTEKNSITVYRGPYVISALMNEGEEKEKHIKGLFADMLTERFDIITEKVLYPDTSAVLYDITKAARSEYSIIGTSVRVNSIIVTDKDFSIKCRGADMLDANIRIYFKNKPVSIRSSAPAFSYEWDSKSSTVLLSFESKATELDITGSF